MRGDLVLTRIACLSMVGWLSAFTAATAKSAPVEGQRIFGAACAACHGLDGHGGEHAPDIATAANIRALTDEQLTGIVRHGIPAAGMPAFAASLKAEEIQGVIGYLRMLQNQQKRPVLSGNPARGRRLFFSLAGCAACHAMNAQGGFIGPDLSNFGKIHSESEIRQAILDPDSSFDARHAMAEITTVRGSTLEGIIRNEDNFSLQIQHFDGSYSLLSKADTAKIKRQTRSPMPNNYGTTLSKSDLEDLIAYLAVEASDEASRDRDQDADDQ